MTLEKMNQLLEKGEGIEIEFKTARFDLNKDTFDSICAFLNRKGGHLLLGVNNNGKVSFPGPQTMGTMLVESSGKSWEKNWEKSWEKPNERSWKYCGKIIPRPFRNWPRN